MGHRYWCSARDGEEGEVEHATVSGPTGGEDGENRRPGATHASTGMGTSTAARPSTASTVQPTTTRLQHPQPQPLPDVSINPNMNSQVGPTSFPMQRSQRSSSPGPSGTQTPPTAQRRGTGGRIARTLGDSLVRALGHGTNSGSSHARQTTNSNTQPVGPEYHPPLQQQQHGQLRIAAVPEANAEGGSGPSTTSSRSNRWSTLLNNFPGRQAATRSSSGPSPSTSNAVPASASRSASGNGQHHQRHDSYSDFQSAMTGVGLRRNDGGGSASELSGMVRSSLVIQPSPPQGRPSPSPQQQQRFRLSAFRPEVAPTPPASNDATISGGGGIVVASVPGPATTVNPNPHGPLTTALYPPNPPWLRSREAGNESQDVEMGWGEGDH
jgi:hypothetical protein